MRKSAFCDRTGGAAQTLAGGPYPAFNIRFVD
jgi:hypothetical protein